MWPNSSAINLENSKRVRQGMTVAEIEEILGGPARDESPADSKRQYVGPQWKPIRLEGVAELENGEFERTWRSADCEIVVIFDADGCAITHGVNHPIDDHESFWRTFRRYLARLLNK